MYFIYHIYGEKIGVTRNPRRRVEQMQGYHITEYEILEVSDDIDYVSKRELELQEEYDYRIDNKQYKNLFKSMKINSTPKTTTFPCEPNGLEKWLKENIGETWEIPDFGEIVLTVEDIDWITSNCHKSQYRDDTCYIYNKKYIQYMQDKTHEIVIFNKIRDWASERGIYDKGDQKTQCLKLYEEAGELSKAILQKDQDEIIDAIGDCVVVLTNLAYLSGVSIESCIAAAYEEISNRKGKMENGTFVKEKL